MSILCNMVVTKTVFQYLSQTTRKSFENTELHGIFYKFILSRYQIMLIRVQLFQGRLVLNPGLNLTQISLSFLLSLEPPIIKLKTK